MKYKKKYNKIDFFYRSKNVIESEILTPKINWKLKKEKLAKVLKAWKLLIILIYIILE